jgi:hypothetical protein
MSFRHCKKYSIITINVPLFLEVRDFMFFRREKHIISHFDFFDVEIALRFAQDNLDVKKVSAPSKNPKKWLNMCFPQLKKHKIPNF